MFRQFLAAVATLAFTCIMPMCSEIGTCRAATTQIQPEVAIDTVTGGTIAVNNLALTSTRTSSAITVRGWGIAKVELRYTYAAATSVVLTPQVSQDGTNWANVSWVASDMTWSSFQPNYKGAASTNLSIPVDIVGAIYFRVVVSATGAAAGDLATVIVWQARGI